MKIELLSLFSSQHGHPQTLMAQLLSPFLLLDTLATIGPVLQMTLVLMVRGEKPLKLIIAGQIQTDIPPGHAVVLRGFTV